MRIFIFLPIKQRNASPKFHEIRLAFRTEAEGVKESEWARNTSKGLLVKFGRGRSGREDHGVNNVDYAVVANYISGNNFGIVYFDSGTVDGNLDASSYHQDIDLILTVTIC